MCSCDGGGASFPDPLREKGRKARGIRGRGDGSNGGGSRDRRALDCVCPPNRRCLRLSPLFLRQVIAACPA